MRPMQRRRQCAGLVVRACVRACLQARCMCPRRAHQTPPHSLPCRGAKPCGTLRGLLGRIVQRLREVEEWEPCPNDGYRDNCGVCDGDGGSCSTIATVRECVRARFAHCEARGVSCSLAWHVWCSCTRRAALTLSFFVSVQALVGILTALVIGISVVWFRLWLTQITYDSKVLMLQLLFSASGGLLQKAKVVVKWGQCRKEDPLCRR